MPRTEKETIIEVFNPVEQSERIIEIFNPT